MAKNLFFIVAYNHENFIKSVVHRIPKDLLEDPENEVLIFDDASKDATFSISQKLREELPEGGAKLSVFKNPSNQGYGGNQKLGYRYAIDNNYKRVFLVHGDGQYAPECLPDLIKSYEENINNEAVFGTRMSNWKSPLKGGMPVYKFVGNKILTWIQNKVLGSKMSEFHSGMRSYAVSLLKRIPFECNSNDYHFDTEIIIQCLSAGTHPVEVPIPTHYGDEDCNVNGMKYAKDILLASLHYRLFRAGFLYDPKFDTVETQAIELIEKDSISTQIIEAVAPNTKALLIGGQESAILRALEEKNVNIDTVTLLETAHLSGPFRSVSPRRFEENLEKTKALLTCNSYNYVILPQTLEHFHNPEAILELIRNNFRAETRPTVIASTSNVGFFIVRIMHLLGQFNYGVGGVLDRNHARLFTSRAFKKLFSQYDYTIQDFKGAPLPLDQVERSIPSIKVLTTLSKGILRAFARIYPSMFAYKIMIKAVPLPSVAQLLDDAREHSEKLVVSGSGPAPQDFSEASPQI